MMPVPPTQIFPVFSSKSDAENPVAGQDAAQFTSPVLTVRIEPTADASLAAIFDLMRFGIAIAAMIRMIATTIKSSIREKPFCFFMHISLRSLFSARARLTLGQGRGHSKNRWY